MTRILPASVLLVVVGVALGACDGVYTSPARAISTDVAASRSGGGSASLTHAHSLDFRDTDLSAH